MKTHNNSRKKSEPTPKRTKSRGPVQRDTKEVLAELVGKLREKLVPKLEQPAQDKSILEVGFAPISTV